MTQDLREGLGNALKSYRVAWLLGKLASAEDEGVRTAELMNVLVPEQDVSRYATESVLREEGILWSPYGVLARGTDPDEVRKAKRRVRSVLNRDIDDLRDAGLVERFDPRWSPGDPPPRATRLTHARLTYPDKRPELHLTAAEHAAVAKARRAIRPGPPILDPMNYLDYAICLLRFVEECKEVVTQRLVMDTYDLPASEARKVIDAIEKIERHFGDADEWDAFPDGDDDIDDDLARGERDEDDSIDELDHPRALPPGMLASMGRWSYTPRECKERLQLIDEYLEDPEVDDETRHLLWSVRDKLGAWKSEVEISLRRR